MILNTDSLAYLTARNNGLDALASEILAASGHSGQKVAEPSGSKLAPPKVVSSTPSANWPTIPGEENFFEKAMLNGHTISEELVNGIDTANETDALDQWAAEDAHAVEEEVEEEAWDLADEDDKFFDPEVQDDEELATDASRGVDEVELWKRNSPFAADHVAAGAFENAMQVCLQPYSTYRRGSS